MRPTPWPSLVLLLASGCSLLWGEEGPRDFDADGFTEDEDCDDMNPGVHPEHGESCDGVDQDCDGVVDDGWDQDGDGFVPCGSSPDCDDADAAIAPGAVEACDGRDNDCDGTTDEDCGPDGDGDGWNEGADCDDTNAMIHPEAIEYCNGHDDDCDTLVDEGLDGDGDGYSGCGAGGDCDDADPSVHEGAAETCDGRDEDCDELVDENFDADQDGSSTCDSPPDCNDVQPTVYPGHGELCDGLDNDCDGSVDEQATGDGDGDGVSGCAGDCDDDDAQTYPGAPDAPGLPDRDCSGGVDTRYSGSSPSSWLLPQAGGTAGRFGDRLALGDWNGDGLGDLLVGSPTWSGGAGRVTLLIGTTWSTSNPPSSWAEFATITGATAEAYFGWSMSFGDLNGDGYDDIVVGEPETNTVAPPNGSARIWWGGPISTGGEWGTASADVTISGAASTEQCGTGVAVVGDVNDDGRQDLAVGCPWYSNGTNLAGRTALFWGRASWAAAYDSDDADASIVGTTADSYTGQAIHGAGDLDADGAEDLVLGSPAWGGGAGRIGVWLGGAAGWATGMTWDGADRLWTGGGTDAAGSWFGAGDVNDDGRLDLLACAAGGMSGAGALGVLWSINPLPASGGFWSRAAFWFTGVTAGEATCRAVARDLDGDGNNDTVVGSGGWDGPLGGDQGRLSIFYGPIGSRSADESTSLANAHVVGGAQGDAFGSELVAGLDLSGDGDLDLVVSAPYQDGGGPSGGRVYVVPGW